LQLTVKIKVRITYIKGHTVTRLNGPLSPPASNNDQEKFYRYLEKWEKFSKPETKWHKDDIKKTSHDEKKKIVHVKKDEKINPDQFKHIKHKLARDETLMVSCQA
jgi:hypothetical protein